MSQEIPISEFRRRLAAMMAKWPIDQVVHITGNTHSTTTVDGLSSIAGLAVGMSISGAGIPAGTTIVAVTGPSSPSITLSAAATATATAVALTIQFTTSNAELHLYAAAFAGGLDPTPASFTEATFDGYSATTISSFNGPYTNPDGTAEIDFGVFGWSLSAIPTVANTIYGYWIDYPDPGGSGTRVVAVWENLPSPISMNAAGDGFTLTVPIILPQPGSATLP